MRLAKLTLATLAILILTGFSYLTISSGASTRQLNFSQPKLQSTEAKLKSINIQYEKLNTQLNTQTSNDKKTIKTLQEQRDEVKQQRDNLQKQVTLKAEEKERLRVAAANAANTLTATQTASAEALPTPAPEPAYVAPVYSGSHEDWMAAAGISPSEYYAVDYIVSHEGAWEPCKINGGAVDCSYAINGGQKAYGVCQALPGSKMASAGDDWATNPVTQLRWCAGYAMKYGGWGGSYNFWLNNKWW